jgi:GT2 family glycosyltransferase
MSPPILAQYSQYPGRRVLDQPVTPGATPIVSVVTVARNAAGTISRTIGSVQEQSFSSIEQIFVDGGSNDGTLEIIRAFARPQDYWISETDRGISDAFNKGVSLARGRFILILNADDWLSLDQVENAVAALEQSGADFVFGDLIFYEGERPVFRYRGDPHYGRVIHRRWPSVGHPTVLVERCAFERIGLFDPAYRNAMDYDWLLRLHRAGGRGVHCPRIVAHMTHDGVSNLQFARTIEEVRQITVAHGRSPLVAMIEAHARQFKTATAQPVKRHMRPLYQLVRGVINPAYKPASTII